MPMKVKKQQHEFLPLLGINFAWKIVLIHLEVLLCDGLKLRLVN